MSVICPHCGNEAEGRPFRCPSCGERIPRYRDTRFETPSPKRFCARCGQPVDAADTECPHCHVPLTDADWIADSADGVRDDLLARFQPGAAVTLKAANQPVHGEVSKRTRREGYRGVVVGVMVVALLVGVVYLGVTTRGFGIFDEFENRPSDLPGAPEAPVAEIAQLDGVSDAAGGVPDEVRQFAVEAKGGLTEYTWAELATIAGEIEAAGVRATGIDIAAHYHLMGSTGVPEPTTKAVDFGNGVSGEVRLADILHDDRSDGLGKAGLTFISSDLPFSHAMRAANTNAGGWEASEMRTWLNGEVYPAMDYELRRVIVPVFKSTNNVGQTFDVASVTDTEDLLWIPSTVEVGDTIGYKWSDAEHREGYDAVMNAEGYQYACFAPLVANNIRANSGIALMHKGYYAAWWLRSPSPSAADLYRNVDNVGDPSWYEVADKQLGVCVGFCL